MSNLSLTQAQLDRLRQFDPSQSYNLVAYRSWNDQTMKKLVELGLVSIEKRGDNVIMASLSEAGKRMLDT